MTDRSQEGFVWPPKPLPEGDLVSPDRGAAEPQAEGELGGQTSGFVDQCADWVRGFEEHWLEPAAVPLAQRKTRLAWWCDGPGVYCERCGSPTGAHEADEFGCSACINRRLPWVRAVRLGAYEAPLLDWVQEVKFQRGWRLGEALGAELGRRLIEAGLVRGSGVIVPVPTTWRRRMGRGIDHARAIARGAAYETGCPLVPALRRVHRPSQRSVPAYQRVRNASGAFRLREGQLRRLRDAEQVVLVDDVLTTGATLRSASRVLQRALRGANGGEAASVWVGVIAVTPRGGGPSRGADQEKTHESGGGRDF